MTGNEQFFKKENQGVRVRYGVLGSGEFVIVDDPAAFHEKSLAMKSGETSVVTLKDGADIPKWLDLKNQALRFRKDHGLSGSYEKTESMLELDEKAELQQLDAAARELEA